MPGDSLIDSILHRFRRLKARPSTSSEVGNSAGAGSQHVHGHFNNAHNFALNNSTIIDTLYMISTGETVMKHLEPYTMPDAAMDSGARHPPPSCHPETRLSIGKKLKGWLHSVKRQWSMIWLRGPAGTGKSAVAQTFAEYCVKWGRLGAAYFFSRANNRNKSETVVPSLVYQLAVAVPEYKSLVTTELANDPLLLHKAPPIQFRKLIIEPFSTLQRQRPRDPIVIILDGLDECKGEDAQLDIIDMITDALRSNKDLPLLWLICSRPEAHLKLAFSRVMDCGREELIIDAECRDDVKRYLRDGITQIKVKYQDITPPDWPPERQLKKLIDTVSGLFVLASTILGYMSDPTRADPVGQLNYLLTFLESAQAVGSRNPLAALDLLYLRILDDISPETFPTTRRILAYFMHTSYDFPRLDSAQVLCNFLRLNQHTFYQALRGLHSVIEVPEPQNAAQAHLQFHHTSFQDFLLDPNRSGKFVIESQQVRVDVAKSALLWYSIDLTCFHANDSGWNFDEGHQHDGLPGLTWISTNNEQYINRSIAYFARVGCWASISRLSWTEVDGDLLSQIYEFDFRYDPGDNLDILANWFYEQDPSNKFVRTEPSNPTDFRLLEYLNLVIDNAVAQPAIFPLGQYNPRRCTREYFFIGHGDKSIIVWSTVLSHKMVHKLSGDEELSEVMIYQYQSDLEMIK